MNKKYVMYIIVALIFVIGMVSFFFLNVKDDSSVYLDINCNGDILSDEYKEKDVFECKLGGDTFRIKVEDISNKKIKLSSSDYGLFPMREDGTISLIDKVKKFELNIGEELVLVLQATDTSDNITIVWK